MLARAGIRKYGKSGYGCKIYSPEEANPPKIFACIINGKIEKNN